MEGITKKYDMEEITKNDGKVYVLEEVRPLELGHFDVWFLLLWLSNIGERKEDFCIVCNIYKCLFVVADHSFNELKTQSIYFVHEYKQQ